MGPFQRYLPFFADIFSFSKHLFMLGVFFLLFSPVAFCLEKDEDWEDARRQPLPSFPLRKAASLSTLVTHVAHVTTSAVTQAQSFLSQFSDSSPSKSHSPRRGSSGNGDFHFSQRLVLPADDPPSSRNGRQHRSLSAPAIPSKISLGNERKQGGSHSSTVPSLTPIAGSSHAAEVSPQRSLSSGSSASSRHSPNSSRPSEETLSVPRPPSRQSPSSASMGVFTLYTPPRDEALQTLLWGPPSLSEGFDLLRITPEENQRYSQNLGLCFFHITRLISPEEKEGVHKEHFTNFIHNLRILKQLTLDLSTQPPPSLRSLVTQEEYKLVGKSDSFFFLYAVVAFQQTILSQGIQSLQTQSYKDIVFLIYRNLTNGMGIPENGMALTRRLSLKFYLETFTTYWNSFLQSSKFLSAHDIFAAVQQEFSASSLFAPLSLYEGPTDSRGLLGQSDPDVLKLKLWTLNGEETPSKDPRRRRDVLRVIERCLPAHMEGFQRNSSHYGRVIRDLLQNPQSRKGFCEHFLGKDLPFNGVFFGQLYALSALQTFVFSQAEPRFREEAKSESILHQFYRSSINQVVSFLHKEDSGQTLFPDLDLLKHSFYKRLLEYYHRHTAKGLSKYDPKIHDLFKDLKTYSP